VVEQRQAAFQRHAGLAQQAELVGQVDHVAGRHLCAGDLTQHHRDRCGQAVVGPGLCLVVGNLGHRVAVHGIVIAAVSVAVAVVVAVARFRVGGGDVGGAVVQLRERAVDHLTGVGVEAGVQLAIAIAVGGAFVEDHVAIGVGDDGVDEPVAVGVEDHGLGTGGGVDHVVGIGNAITFEVDDGGLCVTVLVGVDRHADGHVEHGVRGAVLVGVGDAAIAHFILLSGSRWPVRCTLNLRSSACAESFSS